MHDVASVINFDSNSDRSLNYVASYSAAAVAVVQILQSTGTSD